MPFTTQSPASLRNIILALVAVVLLGCGSPSERLVVFADGSQGHTFRANSGPFGVSRGVTEDEVISDHVRSHRLCTGPFDTVAKRRVFPENPSLVMVEAVVRCR